MQRLGLAELIIKSVCSADKLSHDRYLFSGNQ